jgi:predicted transcriptional regulator
MIRRTLCLLFSCSLLFIIVGCNNTSAGLEKNDITVGCNNTSAALEKNDITEGTEMILMGYATNSYIAMITNEEDISFLNEMFKDAQYNEVDTEIGHPNLFVTFQSTSDSTGFRIDRNNVISMAEKSYKSDSIKFDTLYSIFQKYAK